MLGVGWCFTVLDLGVFMVGRVGCKREFDAKTLGLFETPGLEVIEGVIEDKTEAAEIALLAAMILVNN